MAFLEDLSPPTPAQQAALDRQNEQLHQAQPVRADGPAQVADIARRIGSAAVAIGQNLLHVNQRCPEEIQRITAICQACDQRSRFGFCNICWCNLSQKIRNAGTACPAGKWDAAAHRES